MKKKAIVIHSGGMDSSICLAMAIREFGADQVLSLSFTYQQRHVQELERAQNIATKWDVEHTIIDIQCLAEITENALTNSSLAIEHKARSAPNTLVVGRNGLMARIGAIHANNLGANIVYMGVIEVESANSGYRDCTRDYMDKMQEVLRIDFDQADFEIRTPIIFMTKKETMQACYDLDELEYLLEETITCYEGIEKEGCGKCPACKLRNEGLSDFLKDHKDFSFSYKNKI
jgi:7-cyano-7-deazaguanine synthase